jgi:hypothetical protein
LPELSGVRSARVVLKFRFGLCHAAAEEGQWSLERIFEVQKAGGNIESMVEEVTRRNLLRKEVIKGVTDGEYDIASNKMC